MGYDELDRSIAPLSCGTICSNVPGMGMTQQKILRKKSDGRLVIADHVGDVIENWKGRSKMVWDPSEKLTSMLQKHAFLTYGVAGKTEGGSGKSCNNIKVVGSESWRKPSTAPPKMAAKMAAKASKASKKRPAPQMQEPPKRLKPDTNLELFHRWMEQNKQRLGTHPVLSVGLAQARATLLAPDFLKFEIKWNEEMEKTCTCTESDNVLHGYNIVLNTKHFKPLMYGMPSTMEVGGKVPTSFEHAVTLVIIQAVIRIVSAKHDKSFHLKNFGVEKKVLLERAGLSSVKVTFAPPAPPPAGAGVPRIPKKAAPASPASPASPAASPAAEVEGAAEEGAEEGEIVGE